MKRNGSLLLALMLVAGMAVGCGTSPETSSQNSSQSSSSTSSAVSATDPAPEAGAEVGVYPLADEVVTYTMLNPTSSGEDWSNYRLFQKMEEVTNVRFEFTNTPGGDYETRQNLLLASGDLPDVMWTALKNNNIQKYGVEGGMLFDYASGMETYMPRMMEMLGQYPMALAAVQEMNGAVYVLPKVSMTATESGETLFVRTDYLKQVGKEIPQTIEEFYDAMVALKSAGISDEFVPLLPNVGGSGIAALEACLFPSFGEGVDADFADAGDGKTVAYNRVSEQYRLYLEFMNKLYAEKLLEQEIFSMDSAVITAKIKANNAAFTTSGTSYTMDNFPSGTYDVELVSPMSSQYTETRKMRGVSYEKEGGISISAKAKNPEILMQYFDIWYAVEDVVPGLNGISTKFGIYGQDWEYTTEDKSFYRRIVPADTTMTEEEWRITNVAPATQPPGFAIMTAVASGNPAQEMKGVQCVNNLYPYWQDRFPARFLKFTPEENEILAVRLTDLEKYVKMMEAKFITGAEPLSGWDAYVQTVESMGIGEVLETYQASYDRLNAAKASLS